MQTPYFEQLSDLFNRLIVTERITNVEKLHICEDIQKTLNMIFPKFNCRCVIYTENNDNEFFGDRIYPSYGNPHTIVKKVLGESDDIGVFNSYQLELDSKLFNGSSFTWQGTHIATLILNDINALSGVEPIEEVINAFHNIIFKNDTVIDIEATRKCNELLMFVILESLRYCTSVFCKNTYNDLTGNPIEYKVSDDEMEKKLFEEAIDKVKMHNPEFNGENPSACSYTWIMLEWYLHVYDTIDTDRYPLILLKKAWSYSGSKLFKDRIKQICEILDNKYWYCLHPDIVTEAKTGIFSKMKMDGLKSIEDDLYEYKMRIRNVETQDEALLLMRQINNRMAILDQYLMENEDLPAESLKRWRNVFEKYYKLREELSDKSVYSKKMYGLFVDYNALQQMSNNNVTMNTYY